MELWCVHLTTFPAHITMPHSHSIQPSQPQHRTHPIMPPTTATATTTTTTTTAHTQPIPFADRLCNTEHRHPTRPSTTTTTSRCQLVIVHVRHFRSVLFVPAVLLVLITRSLLVHLRVDEVLLLAHGGHAVGTLVGDGQQRTTAGIRLVTPSARRRRRSESGSGRVVSRTVTSGYRSEKGTVCGMD